MDKEKNRALQLLMSEMPDEIELRWLSKRLQTPAKELRYHIENRILPDQKEMSQFVSKLNISELEVRLAMGILDHTVIQRLSENVEAVARCIPGNQQTTVPESPPIGLTTKLGRLYQGDCLKLMPNLPPNSVDLIFADPPFNLSKLYPSGMNDNLKTQEYISWCEKWTDECVRLLKPGGSLFVWNLPKWNSYMASYLNNRLTFRHWISCDIKFSLPIQGRLYPSHYSLLYYCKGEKPTTFKPDRLQMPICPHCCGDLKDYGGYKHKMNPKGINLTDVWLDIPPVRHAKYKKRVGANELSVKLLDRVIEMASKEGDLVFDPFGGSGTTYVVSELKNRRWLGCELDSLESIKVRFENIADDEAYLQRIRSELNCLVTPQNYRRRTLLNLWTPDSVRRKKEEELLALT